MNSLGEDLLLVAIDPRNGVLRCRSHMHYGLMGAELVMLAAAGRVEVDDDGRLGTAGPAAESTGDPELDAALAKLAAAGRPPKVRGYVSRPRRDLTNAYLDRLIAAGAIQRHGGAFRPRWPVTDVSRAAAVRSQLDVIVLGGGLVGEPQAAYAALADAIGLSWLLYRGKENREARKRLRQITKNHWVAEPVRRASDAADAASAG